MIQQTRCAIRHGTLALAVTAALSFIPAAQAGVLNIDFNRDSGTPTYVGTAVSPDTGTKWNGIALTGQGNPFTISGRALVDSSDAATPVVLDATGTSGWYNTDGVSFAPALRGDCCNPGNFTLHGLTPNETYTLYLYGGGHTYGNTCSWTINAANGGGTVSTNSGGDAVWALGRNYQTKSVTADSIGDLKWTSTGVFFGMQIQGFLSVVQPQTVTLGLTGGPLAEAGSNSATVTATLSETSTLDVTVYLAFSGTAMLDADYTASAANIVIPAGQLSCVVPVTLTAKQDAVYEGDETIVVDIHYVINALESGTQQQTATITDDDPVPVPDVITHGATTIVMDFVSIGDPDNAADTTGSPNPAGAVDHLYSIG